jgi:hypothetical protein
MKAFSIIGCWIVGASIFAPLVDRPKSQPTPEPVIQEAPKLPEPIDCEAKQFSVLRLKDAFSGSLHSAPVFHFLFQISAALRSG